MKFLRFVGHCFRDPAGNMAVDEVLQRSVAAGDPVAHPDGRCPVLRFYGWKPFSLSFGYSQNIARIVDPEMAADAGIGLVRRMTGGKMVFHARELTFFLAVPLDDLQCLFPEARTFLERFRHLLEPLMSALRAVGLEPRFASEAEQRRSGVHGRSREQPREVTAGGLTAAGFPSTGSAKSAPSWRNADTAPSMAVGVHCYLAAAGHSIFLGNRKLVGAAGVNRFGTLAIHGSLPIGAEAPPSRIFRNPAVGLQAQRLEMALLGDVLKPSVIADLPAMVAREYGLAWRLNVRQGDLLESEKTAVERLVRERYSRLDWKIEEMNTSPEF